MNHVWLILDITQAVKYNDYPLLSYLEKMADIFFTFDEQTYARYLAFCAVFQANNEQTHPGARTLLEKGDFSVARSFIPGNRCPVGKTIEETFMKHFEHVSVRCPDTDIILIHHAKTLPRTKWKTQALDQHNRACCWLHTGVVHSIDSCACIQSVWLNKCFQRSWKD